MRKSIKTMLLLAAVLVAPVSTAVAVPVHAEETAPVDAKRQEFVNSLRQLKARLDGLQTKTDAQASKKSDFSFNLKEAIASVTATDEDIYRLADAKHDKAGLIANAKAFIEEVKNYKPVNTERQDYIKSLKDLQNELASVETKTGRQANFKNDLVSKLKEAIASIEATDEDIYRLADAKHDKAGLVKEVNQFIKDMKNYVPDEPRLALVKDLEELKAKVDALNPRLEKNIKAKNDLLFKIKDHIDSIEATDEDKKPNISDVLAGLDGNNLVLDGLNEDVAKDIKKDFTNEPSEDKKPNIQDILGGLDGDKLVLDGLNKDVVNDIKNDFTKVSDNNKPNNVVSQAKPIKAQNVQKAKLPQTAISVTSPYLMALAALGAGYIKRKRK